MSVANNIYRVTYGYFDSSNHLRSPELYDDVQCADTNEATLTAVLTSNGRNRPGLTTKIISVRNVAHGQGVVLS